MCTTCGCSSDEPAQIKKPGFQAKSLAIAGPPQKQLHLLERDVLHKNDHDAAHNRQHFEKKHVLAINLVSSPGSGKTTLLEKTIEALKNEVLFHVLEGDQQTSLDANRIEATGAPVLQINTGKGCHLDASMVHRALHTMPPAEHSVLMIENVGNLVCPALFDLGEKYRVVIISVTEGEDKPLKYPNMFESADICIINKTDLLPYVEFDVEKAKEYALRVNHKLTFFELSATKGQGMNNWLNWLRQEHAAIPV
ncbi:hydrogenase nickel incorporation protein HypB [Pontibacter anaerobius]|uniref:Hydrogenase nickel incorporation protein HypB n=1 Tax=Pontibacter anaerobius TaxID=2993940 RepID=A0ABT3RDB0_9BACT|nr:hydrogenase nickel incorporation protein HypB [Pontibacter anaerobius]MCX2739730.1 hydrogenase nickel incorporation protein HypB [Pontibacter anaerobius]